MATSNTPSENGQQKTPAIRERLEAVEERLSPYASRSKHSQGRERAETPSPLRNRIPAGPGPDNSHQRLPALEAQNSGFYRPRRRSLRNPPNPHLGSGPNRPHHRPPPSISMKTWLRRCPTATTWGILLSVMWAKRPWTNFPNLGSPIACRACG